MGDLAGTHVVVLVLRILRKEPLRSLRRCTQEDDMPLQEPFMDWVCNAKGVWS